MEVPGEVVAALTVIIAATGAYLGGYITPTNRVRSGTVVVPVELPDLVEKELAARRTAADEELHGSVVDRPGEQALATDTVTVEPKQGSTAV